MAGSDAIRNQLLECIKGFLRSIGHEIPPITEKTDLHGSLGLASDEGLDLVLDLCEAFDFDFPDDFNPVVHESGRRGMRFGELVERVSTYLQAKE